MNRRSLLIMILLSLAVLFPPIARGAEKLQKIRIGFPSLAFSYMPFYIAQEKGLLEKHGLEAEYIQMRTGIQPQALINGNINFFPSVSTGISAAASGLPLLVVLNFYNGTPWVLVTNRNVDKPQDLIGKNLAVSGIRTSPHWFMQAALRKWGIPEKDVSFISTGGTSSSFAALTTNQVAGAVLSPPFDDKAVSLGFKKFMFLGDLVPIPYVGLITSQAEVKNHRSRVQKTIVALLDAVAWLRTNREASVKIIADKFKVKQGEAENTYQTMVKMFTNDGHLPLQVARGYLDVLRQDRPIAADADAEKFLDFSLLPAAK